MASLSSLNASNSSFFQEFTDGETLHHSEEETDGDQLSNVPPLVIVSNRVKYHSSLVKLANPGVAVVVYNYESTSLSHILKMIGAKLKARKALCIAFVVHGDPGIFKLNKQYSVSLASVKEDQDVQNFFQDLVFSFLHTTGEFARLDILNCPVQQTLEGKRLIVALSDIVNIPVSSSDDIWGDEVHGQQIGTLYFDKPKLNEWTISSVQKLDKYEKIRVVGKGAYGEAILYRRKEDDSLVILKQINILELNKTERQNVVMEIKILAMLDHPHIISYYDNFEEDGSMMIEMEFADGGSLQQYLNKQSILLSEIEVLTKFLQMVDALNFIHKNNILHRDLKTANVFLTRHGQIKLGDFGIAKVLSATHQAAQTVVGTPYYISPEICEGKYYDTKSDIWSLGCVVYEMLCLQRTFEGTNLPALVHKIVEGSFEPIRGKYSDGLKRTVQKMLQKDPTRRPSASDLYEDNIPPLLSAIQVKEGILQPLEPSPPSDEKDMKSFLYVLDCHSLLFSPVPCPIKDRIINVSIGFGHVVAVTGDTAVFSWGDNRYGQLGHGDTIFCKDPVLIESLKGRNIHSAECGGEFSIFKNENGIIMSCGRGDKGVLGHGNYNHCYQPEIVQDLLAHDSHMISCGESHVAVLTLEWKVFVWGAGEFGQLGTGSNSNCCTPTEIVLRSPGARMDERAVHIQCGMDATVFITETGRVFACGMNSDNKLGLNKRETFIMQMKKNKKHLQVPHSLTPIPIKELGKHRIIDCSLGSTHSAFLTETGLVYTFGRNCEGQLGSGNCMPKEMATIVKGLKDTPMMVTCSELMTCVATKSNSFHVWGSRSVIQSPLTLLLGKKQFKRKSSESTNESNDQEHGSKHEPVSENLKQSDETIANVHQVTCQSSSDYLKLLYSKLSTSDEADISLSRQTSGTSTKMPKKPGPLGLLESKKDVLLKPVNIDLVDRQGTLKSLWEQGLKEVKLEGISSFACNMLILLHAHIAKHTSEGDQQGVVVLGNRLLRRSVVSSTSIGIPISPRRPQVQTPFPLAENDENSTTQRNIENQSNVTFSRSGGELQTWIREELKEGIPLEKTMEESHGWFPETLRLSHTKNNEARPATINKRGHTVIKTNSGLIQTINETNESSPESTCGDTNACLSDSKQPTSKASVKPAKSISDLPMLPNVLNVKRVQSSGSIHYVRGHEKYSNGPKGKLSKMSSSSSNSGGNHLSVRKQQSFETVKVSNGVPYRRPSENKPKKQQSNPIISNNYKDSPYAQRLVPISSRKTSTKPKQSNSSSVSQISQPQKVATDAETPQSSSENINLENSEVGKETNKTDYEVLARQYEEEIKDLKKRMAKLEADKECNIKETLSVETSDDNQQIQQRHSQNVSKTSKKSGRTSRVCLIL